MVALEVDENPDKVELSLASILFLEEMEALEAEYAKDLASAWSLGCRQYKHRIW